MGNGNRFSIPFEEEEVLKGFMRIEEVAALLSVSRRTVYRLLGRGTLASFIVSSHVTLISKQSIFDMIRKLPSNKSTSAETKAKGKKMREVRGRRKSVSASDMAPEGVTHDLYYTMDEVCCKYNYSYPRLYTLRLRYSIPKVHAWGTSCFPKDAIDTAMARELERLGRENPDHWFTCGDIMRLYGLGKTQVRRFAITHGVRTRKTPHKTLYLKADWIAARQCAEGKSSSTKKKRDISYNI
jgi:excisionase family DNA binding protein